MEQSVTTGRRGLRLRRSKPTRSRIAELTRRASQKTGKENLWDGMGGNPYYDRIPPIVCHVPAEGEFPNFARGAFCDPRAGGCRPPTHDPRGSLRGLAPSCTRRRVPPSRRRGATLSRGGPTVIHCRRAPFFVGKRGVRYPFVPKAGRCRRRWVSSTQSFESRSARVPR
jgi:hypothetical protein